jgi:hypothetical protein
MTPDAVKANIGQKTRLRDGRLLLYVCVDWGSRLCKVEDRTGQAKGVENRVELHGGEDDQRRGGLRAWVV